MVLTSNQGLDGLYTNILDQHFRNDTPEELQVLKIVLGSIICAKQPLPLRALVRLGVQSPQSEPTTSSLDDYHRLVRLLASLLKNTDDIDKPLSSFHT